MKKGTLNKLSFLFSLCFVLCSCGKTEASSSEELVPSFFQIIEDSGTDLFYSFSDDIQPSFLHSFRKESKDDGTLSWGATILLSSEMKGVLSLMLGGEAGLFNRQNTSAQSFLSGVYNYSGKVIDKTEEKEGIVSFSIQKISPLQKIVLTYQLSNLPSLTFSSFEELPGKIVIPEGVAAVSLTLSYSDKTEEITVQKADKRSFDIGFPDPAGIIIGKTVSIA